MPQWWSLAHDAGLAGRADAYDATMVEPALMMILDLRWFLSARMVEPGRADAHDDASLGVGFGATMAGALPS